MEHQPNCGLHDKAGKIQASQQTPPDLSLYLKGNRLRNKLNLKSINKKQHLCGFFSKKILKGTHTAESHVESFKGLDSSALHHWGSVAAGQLALFPCSEDLGDRAITLQWRDSIDNKDEKWKCCLSVLDLNLKKLEIRREILESNLAHPATDYHVAHYHSCYERNLETQSSLLSSPQLQVVSLLQDNTPTLAKPESETSAPSSRGGMWNALCLTVVTRPVGSSEREEVRQSHWALFLKSVSLHRSLPWRAPFLMSCSVVFSVLENMTKLKNEIPRFSLFVWILILKKSLSLPIKLLLKSLLSQENQGSELRDFSGATACPLSYSVHCELQDSAVTPDSGKETWCEEEN